MGRVLGLLPLVLLIGCVSEAQQRERCRRAGLDLLLRIDAAFALESGLYSQTLQASQPVGIAPCWASAVQLSALAAAAQVDSFWRPRLEGFILAMDEYFTAHHRVGGYAVQPGAEKPDRYYDDNAWMALALLEAHWLTRNPEHLRRAEEAIAFVLSGEAEPLGGGIWWHEQTRRTRNACSTAPAIVACLRLHQTTGRADYLAAAERLDRWINRNLRDRSGLYLDRIDSEGRVESARFAQNTATMILANCEFFDITRDPRRLDQARALASAAVRQWIDPHTGAIREESPAAALLAESLLQLYRRDGEPRWQQIALSAIAFVRDRAVDRNGWYPSRWDSPARRPISQPRLVDQASAARAMLQAEIVR
ncbi:MAG: glycoside hydrolase family 76 protein [Phycisphaerae bacterium]|nr:glycoside hydrolase family 76 protein [Phycisphaerae bacterium]MDW8263176.1 glycoside hydrolase family 76 protein [Phycisphaerales bacterium]